MLELAGGCDRMREMMVQRAEAHSDQCSHRRVMLRLWHVARESLPASLCRRSLRLSTRALGELKTLLPEAAGPLLAAISERSFTVAELLERSMHAPEIEFAILVHAEDLAQDLADEPTEVRSEVLGSIEPLYSTHGASTSTDPPITRHAAVHGGRPQEPALPTDQSSFMARLHWACAVHPAFHAGRSIRTADLRLRDIAARMPHAARGQRELLAALCLTRDVDEGLAARLLDELERELSRMDQLSLEEECREVHDALDRLDGSPALAALLGFPDRSGELPSAILERQPMQAERLLHEAMRLIRWSYLPRIRSAANAPGRVVESKGRIAGTNVAAELLNRLSACLPDARRFAPSRSVLMHLEIPSEHAAALDDAHSAAEASALRLLGASIEVLAAANGPAARRLAPFLEKSDLIEWMTAPTDVAPIALTRRRFVVRRAPSGHPVSTSIERVVAIAGRIDRHALRIALRRDGALEPCWLDHRQIAAIATQIPGITAADGILVHDGRFVPMDPLLRCAAQALRSAGRALSASELADRLELTPSERPALLDLLALHGSFEHVGSSCFQIVASAAANGLSHATDLDGGLHESGATPAGSRWYLVRPSASDIRKGRLDLGAVPQREQPRLLKMAAADFKPRLDSDGALRLTPRQIALLDLVPGDAILLTTLPAEGAGVYGVRVGALHDLSGTTDFSATLPSRTFLRKPTV